MAEVSDDSIALEMYNISKLYAGTIALENVCFSVRKGELHGIIGKNGAGKSTLVDIMSGIILPTRGEIHVNGHIYKSMTPSIAKKELISIITQEPQVVNDCTVMENLFMPMYEKGRLTVAWKELNRRAVEIMEHGGFPVDVTQPVGDLSVSEKQILLVVKACYIENANIIIMDEVSASLSQRDEQILHNIVRERIAAGKTVILISHRTNELLHMCDRVTVLRDGHNVGTADVKDLTMESLAALIVGNTDYDRMVLPHESIAPDAPIVFEARNLTSYGRYQNVNIKLRKGEIVGIAGLRGAGRTELFKSLVGLGWIDEGKVFVDGIEKRYRAPSEAIRDGVVYLAEEREREGLVNIASIKQNLTIGIFNSVSKGGVIQKKLEDKTVDGLIDVLRVKAYTREQEIQQLSGGNKQKVLVGKIMAQKPRVCFLDEPTRGVDIEAKDSMLHTINEEMRKDSAILISSPGVEDLIKICDRIIVLFNGKIIGEFDKDQFDEKAIYQVMQGEILQEFGGQAS
ncbi:MAG: sugar ABC transporter ATP-binding protein [Clostridia bacterium]